ncbi:MAG: sterol desaturase family protein [Xanthomonadales bacterium]|nr:sterol desaturase family protein [Xanthomonadales bacterium]
MNLLPQSPADLLKASVFVLLLVGLLVLEAAWPRRAHEGGWKRRTRNVALVAVSTLLLRVIAPAGAVAFAAAWHWGALHRVEWPLALEFALSLVLLDLAIYWQHRWFHLLPWLWRAHRVHHSDTGFDVSLGVRFHPLEILPSFAFKLALIAVLGIAPAAVAVYEAMLLGFSLWTHANLAVPIRLDRMLRRFVVTPDWHRVHHAVHLEESNANFGNILSVWDRLFGTAREQPRDGHDAMLIGLNEFRESRDQRLFALLMQPFRSVAAATTPRSKEHDHA